MSSASETDRLVQDRIRLAWLNLNARHLSISPLNGSGVYMKLQDLEFEGIDLNDCVDQAIEKLDGREPLRFGLRPDKKPHLPQSGVPTAGGESPKA
jgi:hypothetical protein